MKFILIRYFILVLISFNIRELSTTLTTRKLLQETNNPDSRNSPDIDVLLAGKPVISIPLNDPTYKNIPVGVNVRFACAGLSPGLQLNYTWAKIGENLPPNAIDDGKGHLAISSISQSDRGKYVCTVRDKTGYIYSKTAMDVNPKEEYNKMWGFLKTDPALLSPNPPEVFMVANIMPNRIIEAGANIRFNCVKDHLDPKKSEYSWYRFDVDGYISQSRRIDDKKGNLYIPAVTPSDSGRYGCSGSGPYKDGKGSSGFSESVFIHVVPRYDTEDNDVTFLSKKNISIQSTPVVSTVRAQPLHLIYKTGDMLKLKCRGLNNLVIEEKTVDQWYSTDRNSSIDKAFQDEDGSFIIPNITKNDEGHYECRGQDGNGLKMAEVFISVVNKYETIEKMHTPLISIHYRDIFVRMGETVGLACNEGVVTQKAQFKWSKSIGELPIERITDDHIGNLIISDAKKTDSGIYHCESKEPNGQGYSSARLNVIDDSQDNSFSSTNGNKTKAFSIYNTNYPQRAIKVGGTLRLSCFEEKLSPERAFYSWSKDDKPLPRGRSYDDHKGNLIITDMTLSDAGVYLCNCNDDLTFKSSKATITVFT